jgi:hypothetical protein
MLVLGDNGLAASTAALSNIETLLFSTITCKKYNNFYILPDSRKWECKEYLCPGIIEC